MTKELSLCLFVITFLSFLNLQAKLSLSIDLKDLKNLLNTKGATWEAEDKDFITENFFVKDGKPVFGLIDEIPEIPESRGDEPCKANDLPESIDWRNFAGQNWMTPVKTQGICGSCVAFATTAAVEGQYNIDSMNHNYDPDLSEQHIFSCGGGTCERGWFTSSGLNFVRRYGAPDETCFPYLSGNTGDNFPCSLSCSNKNERVKFIEGYKSIGNPWYGNYLNEIKAALLDGPLVTTMIVYEDLLYYKSGVYRHVTGERLGGHAVTLVGYDDTENAFIVKNSWGKKWGENGYFRINYYDASGAGRGGMSVILNKPIHFVKIESPGYRNLLSNFVDIKASSSYSETEEATAYIALHNTSETIAAIPLDLSSENEITGDFDSGALENGFYDLWIEARLPDGKAVKSSYTGFYVVNEEPEISLSIKKLFEGNNLPKKAYFLIECKDFDVPLTEFEFSITGPDTEKKYTVSYPCPKYKSGFKTTELPEGNYTIKGKGYTGNDYEFETNEIEVIKE